MRKTYRLYFAIVLILDVVNALSARHAFETGKIFFLILAMVSIATAGYFFIKLMQQEVGIVVNITWVALGTINVTLASWIVFAERITAMQGVAMGVIVTGLVLMEYYAQEEVPAEAVVIDESLIMDDKLNERSSNVRVGPIQANPKEEERKKETSS